MAHLPPSTAIFSPSVARIAASTARDWNYIDSWLSTKFHGHKPPAFERNPDTLKALLALAALNEAADEERDLLARAESSALQELKAAYAKRTEEGSDGDGDDVSSGTGLVDALLGSIEDGLTKEGKSALDAMAALAVQTGTAYPEPEQLGQRMVELQGRTFALDQMSQRVQVMRRFLEQESERMVALLADLQSDAYKPPSDLAKKNLETQRKIKTMAARLPELQDRVAALASTSGTGNHPTIEELAKQEEDYAALLAEKKELEHQVSYFQGLPHDIDSARAEVEALRSDFRRLARKRDAVFEGLVERETPRKGNK